MVYYKHQESDYHETNEDKKITKDIIAELKSANLALKILFSIVLLSIVSYKVYTYSVTTAITNYVMPFIRNSADSGTIKQDEYADVINYLTSRHHTVIVSKTDIHGNYKKIPETLDSDYILSYADTLYIIIDKGRITETKNFAIVRTFRDEYFKKQEDYNDVTIDKNPGPREEVIVTK